MSSSREAVRLYTVIEAAGVLGVSREYVYKRIKARELRVIELGTGTRAKQRVCRDDLDAFIDSRTHPKDS